MKGEKKKNIYIKKKKKVFFHTKSNYFIFIKLAFIINIIKINGEK
jgi:hypothetical protein